MASKPCHSCDNPHKYTCPACGVLSCSVNCVNSHKVKFQCTGQVDPTAFLPKGDLLTTTALDRDYNFLQKISREIVLDKNDAKSHRVIKPRDQWRAGARVHSVAKGMSRSRRNRSKWNDREKYFEWTVEVRKAAGSEYTQVGDKTLVSSIPAMFAYPETFQVFLIDVYGVRHLLKRESTFQDAIRGKDVLEFPTIEIVEAPEDSSDSSSDSSSSSDDDDDDDDSDSEDSNVESQAPNNTAVKLVETEQESDSEPEEESAKDGVV